MADPSSYPGTGDDTGVGRDRGPTSSAPRWVKVFGIITLILIVLLVIMLLIGGHGPGRHRPSAGLGGHTPPAGLHTS